MNFIKLRLLAINIIQIYLQVIFKLNSNKYLAESTTTFSIMDPSSSNNKQSNKKYKQSSASDTQSFPQQNVNHLQQLNIQIKSINTKLIGDLTNSTPINQFSKTLQIVQTFISQIKKLQQIKVRVINERRQAQQNLVQSQKNIQKLVREKKALQNQKQNLFSRLKNLQITHKQFVQKSQTQKQDLTKQIKQLQLRQKGFEAQFRKKQNLIRGLQDGIKKFQDKTPFKNSLEIMQKIQYGPNTYDKSNTNGQNEYSKLAKDAKDQQCKRLTQQNQHLKQCLTNIYKQLNTVLELKCQALKNKKRYDGQYESYFQLNSFRPQTLYLPENWNRQRLKQFDQFFNKFKQIIKAECFDRKDDQIKQSSANGVRNLISNYKKIVETQDQLYFLTENKFRPKELKQSQINSSQNLFMKILDSQQLDKTKKIVKEQTQFLLNNQSQLQQIKKLIKSVGK